MSDSEEKQNAPSPPRPEFGLRTMRNDLQAIHESGGTIPGSQLSAPPSMSIPELKTPIIPEIPDMLSYTGPEKTLSSASMTFNSSTNPLPVSLKKTNFLKSILITFIVLITLTGLIILGYFFIYPMIFPTKENSLLISQQTQSSTLLTPTENPKIIHKSLFKTIPDGGLKELTLANISKENIVSGLKSVFGPDEIANNLREVVLSNNNEVVNFNQFARNIFPELNSSALLNPIFEPDFTIFIFKDKKGDWPGFVAKIKDLARDESIIKENLKKLESSSSVKNLYFLDPGTLEGFKDGKIDNINVRYTLFTQSGAAFNYVLKNNLLIVATSYSGLQAAIELLP